MLCAVREHLRGVARECAKGALAHHSEKKWLEGSTGWKMIRRADKFSRWHAPPFGKFLATLLEHLLHFRIEVVF